MYNFVTINRIGFVVKLYKMKSLPPLQQIHIYTCWLLIKNVDSFSFTTELVYRL